MQPKFGGVCVTADWVKYMLLYIYICYCGDVGVVEMRVTHSIILLYVKNQWAIKLVHVMIIRQNILTMKRH